MNNFLKRTISSICIVFWIFSTIVYFPNLFMSSMIITLFIIAFFEWPKVAQQYRPLFFIYPLISFCLILYLQIYGYKMLNFFTFAACFLADTSSYVFGSLLGKHTLFATISPKKTVEGYLGGCASVIIGYLIFLSWRTGSSWYSLLSIKNIAIPFTINLLACAGDLFESYLKRKSSLKDFGNILPGHGGFLDRFDSILFVVVFVFLLRDYFIKIF